MDSPNCSFAQWAMLEYCVAIAYPTIARVTQAERGKGNKPNAKDCFGLLAVLPTYNGDCLQCCFY